MHHESRFRLGFMTADLQSACRDNSRKNYCGTQHHVAPVLPRTWVILEISLRELAREISAFGKWCGQPVTLRLISNGNAAS